MSRFDGHTGFDNLVLNGTEPREFHGLEEAEFESCHFADIDFSELSFRSWRFLDCSFHKCSFQEIDLVDTTFRDVSFLECRMMGLCWSDTRTFAHVKFEDCKMDYSIFQGLDLTNLSLLNCSATDTDFSNTKLKGARFSGSFLENASFTQADMRTADLRGARGYFIDPSYTQLKGAKADFPEAAIILTALGMDIRLY